MGTPTDRSADLSRLAHAIAQKLVGFDLLHADLLLDQWRRLFYTSFLSGARDAEILKALETPRAATEIAECCIGLSLEEMWRVETIVRSNLWFGHFALAPDTRFGAGYASALEEAKRYDSPPADANGKPH
jgi:hypothetical protein